MDRDVKMSVSQIFRKNGEKTVFVEFSRGKCLAEGKLPEGKLLKSRGFSEEENRSLEEYMLENRHEILGLAGGVNVMKAFMGT